MTVAIIGILIFQIYWISNTYDVSSRAFKQDVNAALESVLSDEITNKTLNRIFGVRADSKDPINYIFKNSDPKSILFHQSKDIVLLDSMTKDESSIVFEWDYQEYYREETITIESEEFPDSMVIKSGMFQQDWKLKPGRAATESFSIEPDEFMEVFGNVYVSVVQTAPNLKEIYDKYSLELENRKIDIPFELAYVVNDRIHQMTGDDPQKFNESQVIQKLPGRQGYGEVIMAYFPKTSSFVLKRMWLTILGSFLLVSLIAGSFILMLQTILKQKKVSEVKNDFINNMTHEFKTPIATVSAALEALVSFDGLADKNRSIRYIDISRKEMTRLSGLVEKVLNHSVFEQKKVSLNKETFDVCKLIHETSQQFIMKGAGRVEIEYDSEGSGYIHADKLHFQNVINNLIDNAVKYSTETVKIDVACNREGEYIVILVKDNGIGISKDQQKHIFEKFYRVPTGDLHGVKGFGLGLSYVKHIVEMHGGTVGVKSQLGIGSEFTIAIPDIHEQ